MFGAFDSILKLASGQMGDALRGIKVKMEAVTIDDAPGRLRGLAIAAGRRGASLHRIAGQMKNGDTLEAFIVLSPAPKKSLTAETVRDNLLV